jgi:hypothetical protein
MFDPLTNRVLIVIGVSFIGLNCLFGYFHCQSYFCPGDNQDDYVYEYKDDAGERYIVIDNSSFPKADYDKTVTKEPQK